MFIDIRFERRRGKELRASRGKKDYCFWLRWEEEDFGRFDGGSVMCIGFRKLDRFWKCK